MNNQFLDSTHIRNQTPISGAVVGDLLKFDVSGWSLVTSVNDTIMGYVAHINSIDGRLTVCVGNGLTTWKGGNAVSNIVNQDISNPSKCIVGGTGKVIGVIKGGAGGLPGNYEGDSFFITAFSPSSGISVVADKSYSYNVNSGCQSYAISNLGTGPNCVGQQGQTYGMAPITCPSIPAPSQTAPSGYKRVCDIVLEGTNFNQTQQNVSLLKYLTINGVGGNMIGGTHRWAQSGQSPKNDTGIILGKDINQSSATTVVLNISIATDGIVGMSLTPPDYRIQIKYHIRLAKI